MSQNDSINNFKSLPDNLNNYLLIEENNDLEKDIINDTSKKISRFKFDFKNKHFLNKLIITKGSYQENKQQQHQSNVRFNELTSLLVGYRNKLQVLPYERNHRSSGNLIETINSKNFNNFDKMINLGSKRDQNQNINLEMLPLVGSDSLKQTNKDIVIYLNQNFNVEPDLDSGLCSASEEPVNILKKLNKPKNKFNSNQISEDLTIRNNDIALFNNENLINVTNSNETSNGLKFLPKYRPFSAINRRFMNNRIKSKQQEDLKEINDYKDDLKLRNSNNQNVKIEMPSLTEINEQLNTTILLQNDFDNNHLPQINLLQDASNSVLQTNQNNSNNNNNNNTFGLNQSEIHNSKQNLLTSLEYLMNNSKGNVFNTTVAIANIAAAASGLENSTNNNDTTETALQTLLIDLVMPTASSQFDIPSTASDPIELSLFYQQQLDNQVATTQTNTLLAGFKQDLNNSNFNFASMNNSTQLHSSNKQTNDQIMRTCMGYLDYINKKHNKERRLQIIKNKISGFILLTIVFLMVFGLAMIMTFFLTNAITKIIKTSRENLKGHEKTEDTSIYSIGIHTNENFPIIPSQNLANIIINKKKTLNGDVSLNLPFLVYNKTSEIEKLSKDLNQSMIKKHLADLLIKSTVRDEIKLSLKNFLKNLFNVTDIDSFFLEQKTNQIQNGIVDFLVSTLAINHDKKDSNLDVNESEGDFQNNEIFNSNLSIENTDASKYYIGYVPELNSVELNLKR